MTRLAAPVNPREVKRAVSETLRREGESGEVSIVFVDDLQIEALNQKYRGLARPTDVLAFPLRETGEPEAAGDLLGEVVISIETTIRQAREFGQSPKKEICLYLIHGTLHLLGFTDTIPSGRRLMRKKEKEVMRILFPET